MEYKKVSDESGLTLEISICNDDKMYIFPGGNAANPSWDEYFNDFIDKYKPHINLVKKIIEENELVGEKACNISDKIHFSFSDGEKWGFTWRAWGDLMQAIVNKREGYIAYYI